MSDDPLKTALSAIPRIATEDSVPTRLLPSGFGAKYELKSFWNAANLLASAHGEQTKQLLDILSAFEISIEDILKGGGNKSEVAKKLETVLHPLG